jgi:hypothetical protein
MTDEERRRIKAEKQRSYRKNNGNAATKKYEKTVNGFLMRVYRNMKSRVEGVQKSKYHLYHGKPLAITKEEFYTWSKMNWDFIRLWDTYESSGYEQKLAPSVDRIDSTLGYEFGNIEWVTHSINSSRGSKSRRLNA